MRLGNCPWCESDLFYVDLLRREAVVVYACMACNRGGTRDVEPAEIGRLDLVIGLGAWMARSVDAAAEPVDPARIPRYRYGAFASDVPVVMGTVFYSEETEAVVNPAFLQGDEMLCSGVKVLVDVGYPPLLDGEVDEYDDQLDVWYVRLT